MTSSGGASESSSPDRARPLLEVSGVSKRFGGVHALQDVNFAAYAGQVSALVGDNGAGKSTLIKTISGSHLPDEGHIYVNGSDTVLRRPSDATQLGISTVYQDLALADNLDVIANLYLGREVRGKRITMDEIAMEVAAEGILTDLSVRIPDLRKPVGFLSGGQRQAVAIARAVMFDAKVLLLDEPTAALGVEQTGQVLNLVLTLKERNLAVVLISHNMEDVLKVADRITVLRLGRSVASLDARRLDRERLVGLMTGAIAAEPTETSVP